MIKALRSGNMLVQEARTFDLVEITPHGKEARRLKGTPSPTLAVEALRSCRHSYDDTIFPWIKGSDDLGLINLKDFSVKEYKGVFSPNPDQGIPLIVVSSQSADRIFTVIISGESLIARYFEKGASSPETVDFKPTFPRSSRWSHSGHDHDGRRQSRQLDALHRGLD